MASSLRFTTTDAAIQANTEAAFTLLKSGITDPECMAPLLQQIEQGQLDLGAQDNGGGSLLLWALLKNNVPIAEALLKAGSDVHQKSDYGTSVLHAAIIKKCGLHMLQLLLTAGADVNASDLAGNTPLHLAATNSRAEIVQTLITAGADTELLNNEEQTPLCKSVFEQNNAAQMPLLLAGSSLNKVDLSADQTISLGNGVLEHMTKWDRQYRAFLAGHFHPKTQADWLGLASVMPLPDPHAYSPVALRVEWLQEYARQPSLKQRHAQANANAAQGWGV